jgi:flagellar protein FlaJ
MILVQKIVSKKQHTFIGKLAIYVAKSLSSDVLFSGKPENLILLAKKYVKISLISAMIVYPFIAGLVIIHEYELQELDHQKKLYENERNERQLDLLRRGIIEPISETSPVFSPNLSSSIVVAGLVLGIIPPFLFFYPKMVLKNQSKSRKNQVEEELSFFGIYAAIMHTVNPSLYSCFLSVIGRKVFGGIEKEALLLKRNVELFGLSPLEAIEDLGRNHKSQTFKNFLLGYSSIARSGGDLSKYLETVSDEQFQQLKIKYTTYSKNVGYIVESLIILLVVVPILFVVSSFILPTDSISKIMIASAIAVPIMTVFFAVVLQNIQPKMFNMVGLSNTKFLLIIPIGAIVFSLMTYMKFETWLSLGMGAIIPSIIVEFYTRKHKYQIERIERILPQFLRDITEYRKIGISETAAITKIVEENTYNKTFDRLVRTLSVSFKQGNTFSEILSIIRLRSWFARTTFFILAEISESGGGHPAILESVTIFVNNTRSALKEARSSISVYDFLAYLSPVLLIFSISIINEMISSVSLAQSTGLKLQGYEQLIQVSPLFLEVIKTFSITSSIGIGILMGKASDGTFKSTGRIAILCVISVVAIFLVEQTSVLDIFGDFR